MLFKDLKFGDAFKFIGSRDKHTYLKCDINLYGDILLHNYPGYAVIGGRGKGTVVSQEFDLADEDALVEIIEGK